MGFRNQAAKGSYLAPDTWLVHSAEGILREHNYVFLNHADQHDWESKYHSGGRWADGTLSIPLVPGTLTNLIAWILTRDADNQGNWASALIDCVRTVKQLTDMKVRTASFSLEKGDIATVDLAVTALAIAAGSAGSPSFSTAAPYVFSESAVQLGTGGGALAAANDIERITIDVDNGVEDAPEGLRLRSSDAPYQLYNTSGMRVTGSFSRDFVDSAVYDDFLAGTEATLSLALTRSCDVVTFTLPRIVYDTDDAASPGTKDERIVEGVTFRALGSANGATAPLAISIAP